MRPNQYRRINTPAWLSDREGIAPCICGEPLSDGEPYVVGTSETGLKRWFHADCFAFAIEDDDDEE